MDGVHSYSMKESPGAMVSMAMYGTLEYMGQRIVTKFYRYISSLGDGGQHFDSAGVHVQGAQDGTTYIQEEIG